MEVEQTAEQFLRDVMLGNLIDVTDIQITAAKALLPYEKKQPQKTKTQEKEEKAMLSAKKWS